MAIFEPSFLLVIMKYFYIFVLILFLITMETTQELRKRSEIPKEDQWNVESLYPSVEEWEVEFKKASDEKSNRETL